MERKQTERDAEAANRQINGPEDRRQRRADAQGDAAQQPFAGAPVHQARVGAELAAEGKALDQGETAQAIKRAAENDRRP